VEGSLALCVQAFYSGEDEEARDFLLLGGANSEDENEDDEDAQREAAVLLAAAVAAKKVAKEAKEAAAAARAAAAHGGGVGKVGGGDAALAEAKARALTPPPLMPGWSGADPGSSSRRYATPVDPQVCWLSRPLSGCARSRAHLWVWFGPTISLAARLKNTRGKLAVFIGSIR
jgi:hypothetical protein